MIQINQQDTGNKINEIKQDKTSVTTKICINCMHDCIIKGFGVNA